MIGIVGYGAYIPVWRIKNSEIAKVWGSNKAGDAEKAVAGVDEDTTTMAVEASIIALSRSGIDAKKIGAIYVGSESHPYAVKPTASIVAEAIGATPELTAADFEFACKAGTAAWQAVCGLIASGKIEYGLAVGSDTAQGRPGDELEYTAASGAGAYIFGEKGVIASLDYTCSFTTDTPDFWRREGELYPRHGGRFTGEPAYFKHVISATKLLLEKTSTKIEDYDYFIFHQPNAKFPLRVAKILGIPKEKIMPGFIVNEIGNTYSANVQIALAAVLDIAMPGEKILVTSFGSGAGSDSFSFTVTNKIEEKRHKGVPVRELIKNKKYIDYAMYAKFRKKLRGATG
ncbi:MAG TPA: hydroxymethylglutaryl-CoA synthase [Candidatus Aenigmarchaeota archaeon]|nr:hydroxymethylglutaryl-CoA synthase [Candidatus Aenigmarchaeota archaeon]